MVIGGRVTVDQDHVIAAEITDIGRGGIDRQRRARYDQDVCGADIVECLHDGILGQGFFIQHDVGLDDTAALTRRHTLALCDLLYAVELAALHAVIAQDRAVQLMHAHTARRLVQTVDVLGHNGAQLALFLPLREL